MIDTRTVEQLVELFRTHEIIEGYWDELSADEKPQWLHRLAQSLDGRAVERPTELGQIAAILRNDMAARGWSAAKLARLLDASSAGVHQWLTAKNAPGPRYRRLLARTFGRPEFSYQAVKANGHTE